MPPFWGWKIELELQLLGEPRQDVARPVLRAVVDDDQLGADRDREDAADDFLDGVALVVAGHHHREQRIFENSEESRHLTLRLLLVALGMLLPPAPRRLARWCRRLRTSAPSRAPGGCGRSTRRARPDRLRGVDRACRAPACRRSVQSTAGSHGRRSDGRCRGCRRSTALHGEARRATGGARTPGRQRARNRADRCRRASRSPRRRPGTCRGPAAASIAFGITCSSGSWCSPSAPPGSAPAALK